MTGCVAPSAWPVDPAAPLEAGSDPAVEEGTGSEEYEPAASAPSRSAVAEADAGGATGREGPPAGAAWSVGTSMPGMATSASGVLDAWMEAPTRPITSETLCWVPLGSWPARVMRMPAESIDVGVSLAG